MASISVTDIQYYLKELYDGQTVATLVPKGNPLLDMMTKDTGGGGKYYPLPVNVNSAQGIGSKFSTAQSNATAGSGKEFLLTYGRNFMVYRIDEETIRTATGGNTSFESAIDGEMKRLMTTYGITLSRQVWGNGGSPIGRRASANTNVITLTNPADTYNFFVGMTVNASDVDGSGGSGTARVGSTTVASVDREAGTVTLVSAAGITDFADNDYLFRAGEFQGVSATTGVKLMTGMQGWVPSSVTSTAFFGVDRTTDTRLAGTRLSTAQTQGSSIERVRRLCAFANTVADCEARHFFVSPMQLEVCSIILGQKGYSEITLSNSTGTFGYEGIEFRASYGRIKMIADRHCPDTLGLLVNMDEVKLVTVGDMVDPLDRGGSELLHISDEAGWERRWITLGNVAVTNPGQHARCTLQAAA